MFTKFKCGELKYRNNFPVLNEHGKNIVIKYFLNTIRVLCSTRLLLENFVDIQKFMNLSL